MKIKKYLTVFKASWSRTMTYRVDLLMWRLRSIMVLVMLYYVWHSLTLSSGKFAGYTSSEIFTYVLWVNFLRSAVFGTQTRQMAAEINNGWFNKYLVTPVNFFWYEFFRELAERIINLILAIIEVVIFYFIVKPEIILQADIKIIIIFIFSVLLALFLYYLLSYLMALIAFWSREAMGPRFLFEWTLEFCSGAFFPIDILSKAIFSFLHFLPFAYLIFLPINIYLSRINLQSAGLVILIQLFWILTFSFLVYMTWNKGLKKYTGEGI